MLLQLGKNKLMNTSEIFKNYNLELIKERIPIGNESIETYSITDPLDPVFHTSFKELCSSEVNKSEAIFL